MFSPYSPAFDSDVGTLPCAVLAELAVRGVTALFVLAAPCEPDEHAVIQIIIITTTANKPRATGFHQSRGSLLDTLSIVFLLFLQLRRAPDTSHRIKYPARSTSACSRISLFRNGHLQRRSFL